MKSFRLLLSRFRFLAVIILTAAIIVGVGIGIQLLFDRSNSPQLPVSVPTTQPTISASDPSSPPVASPTPGTDRYLLPKKGILRQRSSRSF